MAQRSRSLQDAQRALSGYYRELRRRKTYTVVSGAMLSVCLLLFIMLVSGDRFQKTLGFLGLEPFYWRHKGVYADCRNPENANNALCQRTEVRRERVWSNAKGKGPAFNLHSRN